MTSDRKKPGVAFWATVTLVVVLVGYPLSYGPVRWIIQQLPGQQTPEWASDAFSWFYGPLIWASLECKPIGAFLDWSIDIFGT
jgi:hypothetical protein